MGQRPAGQKRIATADHWPMLGRCQCQRPLLIIDHQRYRTGMALLENLQQVVIGTVPGLQRLITATRPTLQGQFAPGVLKGCHTIPACRSIRPRILPALPAVGQILRKQPGDAYLGMVFCNFAARMRQRTRNIAQPGRALRSGRRGRRFESCYSDQFRSLSQGPTKKAAFAAFFVSSQSANRGFSV